MSEVEAFGQRLLDELAVGSHDVPALAASLGIALIPRDGTDAESLLRAVDVALRVAKRLGRHRLSVYAGEPLSADGAGGVRETLLRLIDGEGLTIAVQPIVSARDWRPHAYEALARFQLGVTTSPLHWFALAEEFGLRDS